MKFPYIVNHDGTYYPAGADVPVEDKIQSNDNPFVEDEPQTAPETQEILIEPKIVSEATTETVKRGRPPKSK